MVSSTIALNLLKDRIFAVDGIAVTSLCIIKIKYNH